MAASAPEVGRQTGQEMGFPSEKDQENQSGQVNHGHSVSTCNMNGGSLADLQERDAEPQAVDCESSEVSVRPEADSNVTDSSPEENQEVSEGQTADSFQLPSNDDQAAIPPERKKRKRRRRKRIGYIRKTSKTAPASNAEPKKETIRKTPAKRKLKVISEPVPQTPVHHDSPAAPESPEMTLGGRPKRRAAKAALEYLHNITKDLEHHDVASGKRKGDSPDQPASPAQKKASGRGRGQKRKALDYDSDQCDDTDFDPEDHEMESEEDEEEEVEEEEYGEEMSGLFKKERKLANKHRLVGSNGLSNCAMQPVWTSFKSTKAFREEHSSAWVFSEWIPSVSDWRLLSTSEAEKYLPQEEESAAFTLSREGIKEERSLHTMKRFESLPPHAERWDSLFFVGGPVWAMEWCPLPEGAAETQYAALYCNRSVDDRHKANVLCTEQTLLQLWDLGKLQISRPSSSPQLAYALAIDEGCIWNLKWCPAGAWELPTTDRKAPHLPRLGLIAAAFSNGTIAVYSLPHPKALTAQSQARGEASQAPLIYRVRRIMTVELGSSQADHNGRSGQCFALDWLPVKPHNILAGGFYDGTVALWDLSTKSSLQRVRSPDRSLCLFPYHCFLAHDNTVRSLTWCRASSELLVTVGDDRMVKFWDITKTCIPLKAIKRFLPTEVSWPILWSGIFQTQECCFTTLGQQGLHYLDSGYLGHKPFFVCTRKATVWSLSVSDWINSCVMGDNIGDLVFSLLCDPDCNYANTKRHRFPVYRTELVQFTPGQSLKQPQEEEEEEVGDAPQEEPQSYRGAAKKYYLHFHDMDLRSFKKYQEKPLMKKLHTSEIKGILSVDQMPLNALYKVRFNPNMDAHGWVLSAGQSGLVRVHCVRGLSGSLMHKLVHEAQAQFSAMFHSQEPDSTATAVRHCTADTVQVR
ncbi:general transcription factor 3C polypeptide 2 [Colossoma macropomum]|uniref:general transcription factor 3C polypeptide 2 n=1 Tax=Colossoma macropomum TaxID=42526 RepID=UPI001864E1B4|nr:general transcription factor 3C polypeptide 2 [Colossoma macropomum]XP_036437079.1 general transcription factor 3C polypeptide 2 [Colossoma macropomum]